MHPFVFDALSSAPTCSVPSSLISATYLLQKSVTVDGIEPCKRPKGPGSTICRQTASSSCGHEALAARQTFLQSNLSCLSVHWVSVPIYYCRDSRQIFSASMRKQFQVDMHNALVLCQEPQLRCLGVPQLVEGVVRGQAHQELLSDD